MTPSELKSYVEQTDTDSHFFTWKTMKFFGDTMRNYGVRSATVISQYDGNGEYVGKDGVAVECWELYRKRPVKHNACDSAYFDKETFRRVYPAREV